MLLEAKTMAQFYGNDEKMYECAYENEGPCIGYIPGEYQEDDFEKIDGKRTPHFGKRARQFLSKLEKEGVYG